MNVLFPAPLSPIKRNFFVVLGTVSAPNLTAAGAVAKPPVTGVAGSSCDGARFADLALYGFENVLKCASTADPIHF